MLLIQTFDRLIQQILPDQTVDRGQARASGWPPPGRLFSKLPGMRLPRFFLVPSVAQIDFRMVGFSSHGHRHSLREGLVAAEKSRTPATSALKLLSVRSASSTPPLNPSDWIVLAEGDCDVGSGQTLLDVNLAVVDVAGDCACVDGLEVLHKIGRDVQVANA